MKFKEWFTSIAKPLFEKPEEADLFLAASDLKEIEVPENIQKAFSKTYLTKESALSDPELAAKFSKDAKGLVFGSVDQKIKKILPLLPAEVQQKILAEPNTLLKIELLEEAIPGLTKNEDVKKVTEASRKKEQELHDKILLLESEKTKLNDNFASQVKNVKLDYALKNKVFGFELAPEFATDKHRNFLADSTISSLKKDFVLEFDEKDESIIHLRKNVEGVIKDVFEDNKKVTLDEVLKKEYTPYIKKSSTQEPIKSPKKEIKAPSDQPVGRTLDEIRKAQVSV